MVSSNSKVVRALRCGLLLWIAFGVHLTHGQSVVVGHTTSSSSVDELSAKARSGSAQAQYELGYRYSVGDGVVMSRVLALKYFVASAEQGFAMAEYELAKYHGGLTGETLDLDQSFVFTRRAAEHGYGPAQADLGFIYFNGNSRIAKNLSLSFKWFAQAAKNGSVVAQCMLGDFYKSGLGGVKQNYLEAFKWYMLTATKNDKCAPKSQFELYVSYESGNGVRKDLKTAVTWLRRAAESGNPQAQFTLGRLYHDGHGVIRNPELAKTWLRKSREGVAPHDDDVHDEDGRHAHVH